MLTLASGSLDSAMCWDTATHCECNPSVCFVAKGLTSSPCVACCARRWVKARREGGNPLVRPGTEACCRDQQAKLERVASTELHQDCVPTWAECTRTRSIFFPGLISSQPDLMGGFQGQSWALTGTGRWHAHLLPPPTLGIPSLSPLVIQKTFWFVV